MFNPASCEYIRLQGLPAPVAGIRGADLQPGNVIVWNYGYTSTVISVTPSKTGKTLSLVTRDDNSGKVYTRKTTPGRLFGLYLLRRPS